MKIDELTKEELEAIMERYGLRKVVRKDGTTPSFQVVRSRAIRVVVKEVAKLHGQPQKNVRLLDTHKDGTTYYILVRCEKTIHEGLVDVTNVDSMRLMNVVTTDKVRY